MTSSPDVTEERPPADGERSTTDDGPEREICVVRPAMFRAHPLRYLLILLILAGGITLAVMSLIKRPEEGAFQPWLLYPGLLLVLASVVWWVQWWIATTLWIKVSISNKRTIRHEGIIRRHSTEVLHDHVRSVDINQRFLQRIFNVGYIGIDSAGQDGIEIEVRDIPAPYEVKEIIDR